MRTHIIDLSEKTLIGGAGFLGSIGLAQVNQMLSAIVALLTIIYLSLSIYKKFKEK